MSVTEFLVHMDCAGCESKIKKALYKLDGVDEVDVDLSTQKVSVMGWAKQREILRMVKKTGRKAELWPYGQYPYVPDYYNSNQEEQSYDNYQQQQYYSKSNPLITYHSVPSRTSSYNNYDNHEYNSNINNSNFYDNYYQNPGYNIVDERASTMFSDENPHACSIM